MKITIEVEESEQFGLSPSYVYRSLCKEYWLKERRKSGIDFLGMENACNAVARELYAHKKQRRSNVKNLILTYSDAEECFDLYKQFADVWIRNIISVERQANYEKT